VFYYLLSIRGKEAGDPTCTHTISGKTEQELFDNAKKHAMEEHGMTATEFEEDAKKNEEKNRSLIKKT
jgi:predicted small metal-binding protein